MGKANGWKHIAEVMDGLGLALGGELDIDKRMVLVASMGFNLRLNETFIAHEELTDLICHSLKVVGWMESWPQHVRKCIEDYPIEWFTEQKNCFEFYWAYKKFYLAVQELAFKETRHRFI